MLAEIHRFKQALAGMTVEQGSELRGELVALGVELTEKLGEPYTYGLPGSDPNVEQMPDGSIVVALIHPIQSGSENITLLKLRMPTVGDRKGLPSGHMEGALELIRRTATVHPSGRPFAPSELDKMGEEDFTGVAGALDFLRHRFRRTGKVFRTT